ncbi:WD40 repeat-containing protein [Histomonas meleagridis]|uniref:WD40 repeat-containing protein n=1 Tax=Histomonas meleagridis TaxID=135588 RepID=UPI003559F483|nr:WD40 repeat-containing protein [Histomonas meleagridis]KAH0800807.1 WD40 repeat-containing protein [Histomonas meleagridis]
MTKSMTLLGHKGCINTCSFNPYGNFELTGCDDGSVWLWDIGNHQSKPKIRLIPHKTNVFTTNFLSETRFISGGNDASVQVIELADGRAVSTKYSNHHTRKVLCSFVVDEHTFATCSQKTVRLFDTRIQYTGQSQHNLDFLTEADFDYDGQQKLYDDLTNNHIRPQSDGGGCYLPSTTPTDPNSILLDFTNNPNMEFFTMDIHPIDRKRFIASCGDGTVRMFDLRMIRQNKPQQIGFEFNKHYGRIMSVTGATFNETGDRIAATIIGGNIHVLDPSLGIDVSHIQPPRPRSFQINLADFINQETGTFDFALLNRFANQQTVVEEEEEEERHPVLGEVIELYGGHQSQSTIKTVNWMGKFVVTGSDNGSICFYDPDTGDPVNIVKGHKGNVNVVTVHKEKMLLATSGIDDFAVLWEPMKISKVQMNEIKERNEAALQEPEEPENLMCNVM